MIGFLTRRQDHIGTTAKILTENSGTEARAPQSRLKIGLVERSNGAKHGLDEGLEYLVREYGVAGKVAIKNVRNLIVLGDDFKLAARYM